MTEADKAAEGSPKPDKRARRPRRSKAPAEPPRVVRIWRELDGDEDLHDVARHAAAEQPPLLTQY